jgi:hypothetical protein
MELVQLAPALVDSFIILLVAVESARVTMAAHEDPQQTPRRYKIQWLPRKGMGSLSGDPHREKAKLLQRSTTAKTLGICETPPHRRADTKLYMPGERDVRLRYLMSPAVVLLCASRMIKCSNMVPNSQPAELVKLAFL